MQLDLLEGKRRRDEGLDRASQTSSDFLSHCRSLAYRHAISNGETSINDVRRGLEGIPHDVNPNVLGAVFKEKMWEAVGYTQAEHPNAHARTIRVYKLK